MHQYIEAISSACKCVALTLAVSLIAMPSAAGQDGRIDLVCNGSGSHTETETNYVNSYDYRHHRYEGGAVTSTGKVPFSGSAYVEVSGPFARIKLPSAILPLIRSTHDGWSDIQDVFIDDREITGKIRINGLNKPKMRIDRITGIIDISGGGGEFNGNCEPIDTERGRKF